jgi:hypothetical protein
MSASVDHDSPAKKAAERHQLNEERLVASRSQFVGELYAECVHLNELVAQAKEALGKSIEWLEVVEEPQAVHGVTGVFSAYLALERHQARMAADECFDPKARGS